MLNKSTELCYLWLWFAIGRWGLILVYCSSLLGILFSREAFYASIISPLNLWFVPYCLEVWNCVSKLTYGFCSSFVFPVREIAATNFIEDTQYVVDYFSILLVQLGFSLWTQKPKGFRFLRNSLYLPFLLTY